jgi:hypothetical protein
MGPVFAGANEAEAQPPPNAPADGKQEIGSWFSELAAASSNGRSAPYNYAVGHLGHEFGHRWGAYVTAKVNGETIRLGPWPHWGPALQAPVAYPYSLPLEASTLGGAVWRDNGNGTYTRLREGYFVPAAGYSYLDLYLMGLMSAAEVPDFFLLNKLVRSGTDVSGRPIYKADKVKLTVGDVVAAEGARLPDVDHSQRRFNTGIVVIVEHGRRPSQRLLREAAGISRQWITYWRTVTGHRASMTANPR